MCSCPAARLLAADHHLTAGAILNNRVEWFLTGVVSVCAAFLLSVCLGTALVLFFDDDTSLKAASAPQPARTGESSPKGVYEND